MWRLFGASLAAYLVQVYFASARTTVADSTYCLLFNSSVVSSAEFCTRFLELQKSCILLNLIDNLACVTFN